MKNTHILFVQLFVLLVGFRSIAQPNTDVYLMDMRRSSEAIVFENHTNISENAGYDNQPSFWSDSESILYVRNMEGQTDIVRFYFESSSTIRVSKTPGGSEYSPLMMPDGRVSSIRLDTTGLQLLYAYKLNGKNKVLVPDLKIGYHAWINEDEIVAFVLGEPATLQLVNVKSNTAKILSENIGRSLHKIPGTNAFSFVDKSSDNWTIRSMDPVTSEVKVLTDVIKGAEDYCWTPRGEIIMGYESKLYMWQSGSEWKEIADLSVKGIENITRITVSPDGKKLALVGSD
ncbi:MAG: hypothetical protein HRT61_08360 [Ekhidna sp.]|nr:hypothetical protein [Ekhidna sp.]